MIPGFNNIYHDGRQPYDNPGYGYTENAHLMHTPSLSLSVQTRSNIDQTSFDAPNLAINGAMNSPNLTPTSSMPASIPAPPDPGQTCVKDNFRLTKQHYQAEREGHWVPYSSHQTGSSKSSEGYVCSKAICRLTDAKVKKVIPAILEKRALSQRCMIHMSLSRANDRSRWRSTSLGSYYSAGEVTDSMEAERLRIMGSF